MANEHPTSGCHVEETKRTFSLPEKSLETFFPAPISATNPSAFIETFTSGLEKNREVAATCSTVM
ncbi:hypothetical protein ACV334_35535, partial [Pseudomonas aeruginosa]